MPDSYRKPYFDACLFIAWVQNEVREGIMRGEIVEHLFQMARRGKFQIYYSAITLSEVHKVPEYTVTSEDEDLILSLLETQIFVCIDVDRNVGEEANRLCRRYHLKPMDALHLACAAKAECDVLLTWDDKLLKAEHPRVLTTTPSMIGDISLFSGPELQDPGF